MKNKGTRHISEGELDGLLKEAFLDLDFENVRNKEALELVGNYAMRKNTLLGFFSLKRLNFLLLVLSVLIFLNSFYRYLEPLINKDGKKYEPLLGISSVKKNDAIINKAFPVVKPKISTESKKNVVERTLTLKGKQNKVEPKTVLLAKKEKTDSSLLFKKWQESADSNANKINHFVVDSLAKSSIASNSETVLSPAKKIKPERKITQKVTTKKGKTPRLGKGSRFRKNGTFIMKGGRYGKSRKIQR
ncbi:MAG: hypothetical protein JNL60_03705 [Bacteroidia bacterium]|nr:hypothetical protein [Bacteroidia bacterium]